MFDLTRLRPSEAALFQEIRLEALGAHPEAFGETLESARRRPLAAVAQRLERNAVFGGFWGEKSLGGKLLGVVGFHAKEWEKERHKGTLWGLYVRAAARGSGLGEALVRHLLDHARGRVELVQLAVIATNEPAIALYERCGFKRYGLETHALKVGNRYYDEALMERLLDEPEPAPL